MFEIATFEDMIPVSIYGGKAYWLKWLYDQGIEVPESIFIPAMSQKEQLDLRTNQVLKKKLQKSINHHFGNELLAVRSSALDEDGFVESKAGNYRSCLYVCGFSGVMSALKKIWKGIGKEIRLGIVVQKMVQAKYAGVIFSSDPKDGNRKKLHIAATLGLGDKLLSGISTGEEICVEITDGEVLAKNTSALINHDCLTHLVLLSKDIESKLNYPVDIEWCVEKDSERLILLQCRPMTGIFPKKDEIIQITDENMKNIPGYLISNNKVLLRKLAEKYHFQISKAYMMVCSCREEALPYMEFSYNKPDYFSGYSVVLLSPSKIHGAVQRFFVGNKKRVYSVTRCHRFGVRQVASYDQINKCLIDLYQTAKTKQWACSAIIQEIWDAKFTGIIRHSGDGYILEIARGHFLSKGITPMSMYITDSCGKILYQKEIWQNRYINIVEGCILEYRMENAEKIVLSEECIGNVIASVKELLDTQNLIVEFGLLRNDSLTPYVIDCTPVETIDSDLSSDSIRKGVISEGRVEGTVVKLSITNETDSFNKHFYNEISDISAEKGEQNYIFCTNLPDIRLIDILNQYNHKHIGFVFEEGSLLCHLAVLLRERGIPAICGVDSNTLEEGAVYCLDTTKPEMRKI